MKEAVFVGRKESIQGLGKRQTCKSVLFYVTALPLFFSSIKSSTFFIKVCKAPCRRAFSCDGSGGGTKRTWPEARITLSPSPAAFTATACYVSSF